MDLVESLREAQKHLRELLCDNPEFQDYENLTAMIARYAAVAEGAIAAGQTEPQEPAASKSPAAPARSPTGMRAVQDSAVEYLRQKGSRASSGELFPEMVRRGLLRLGQEKVLTSYLSRDHGRLDNRRGEGYGLKEWTTRPRPGSGAPVGAPRGNGLEVSA